MIQAAQHAFQVIRDGVGLWLEHNAFLHAGALAFFTLFSLAPTLIIAVTAIASAYGAAASLLVVLMWVYFSALLLLLGAAVTRASLRDGHRGTGLG
jgi:uncharacterized BrkB/YihY/UPF0761 family membrane protein